MVRLSFPTYRSAQGGSVEFRISCFDPGPPLLILAMPRFIGILENIVSFMHPHPPSKSLVLTPQTHEVEYPEYFDCATQYRTLAWEDVSDSILADWNDLRAAQAHYRSPFWSPQFIGHVAEIRPGVELAVATRNGRAIAVLPFRRHGKDARPVGAGINDAHGLLADASVEFSFDEFLIECGLRSFAFHASPPSTPGIRQFEFGRVKSFLADLSAEPSGYTHFLRARSRTIEKQAQKSRKLGREVGKLRFEYDCRDDAVLSRLFRLKSQQYRRTHTFDILSVAWIQALIRRLHRVPRQQGPGVLGVLNVLFAGDTPIALHFGMEENDLLHYWFPVYDPRYDFGSPGTQLFLDVADEALRRGVSAIDMGYGEQPYKHKLTNVVSEMSLGLVDRSYVRRSLFRSQLALRSKLKELKIRERVKPIARRIMPDFGASNYLD